jgi:hypothetical protein
VQHRLEGLLRNIVYDTNHRVLSFRTLSIQEGRKERSRQSISERGQREVESGGRQRERERESGRESVCVRMLSESYQYAILCMYVIYDMTFSTI